LQEVGKMSEQKDAWPIASPRTTAPVGATLLAPVRFNRNGFFSMRSRRLAQHLDTFTASALYECFRIGGCFLRNSRARAR
jgi:hypothetical protein